MYLTANKRRNRRRFILLHLKDPSELYEDVYDESRDDVSAKWNKRTYIRKLKEHKKLR